VNDEQPATPTLFVDGQRYLFVLIDQTKRTGTVVKRQGDELLIRNPRNNEFIVPITSLLYAEPLP
jgi:hypothetical protein